jgi:hypothetical protein
VVGDSVLLYDDGPAQHRRPSGTDLRVCLISLRRAHATSLDRQHSEVAVNCPGLVSMCLNHGREWLLRSPEARRTTSAIAESARSRPVGSQAGATIE